MAKPLKPRRYTGPPEEAVKTIVRPRFLLKDLADTKKEALQAVRDGMSVPEVAKIIGCHVSTLYQWLKAAGVSPAPTNRDVFSEEVKRKAVYDYLVEQKPATGIARKIGCSAWTVHAWVKSRKYEPKPDSKPADWKPEPEPKLSEPKIGRPLLQGTEDVITTTNLSTQITIYVNEVVRTAMKTFAPKLSVEHFVIMMQSLFADYERIRKENAEFRASAELWKKTAAKLAEQLNNIR